MSENNIFFFQNSPPKTMGSWGKRRNGKGSDPLPQENSIFKNQAVSFFRSLRTLPLRDLSILGFSSTSSSSSSSSSSSNININSIYSIDSPIKEIRWNSAGTRVACTHIDRSISIWPALDPFETKGSWMNGSSVAAYSSFLASIVHQSHIVVLRAAHDRSIEAISWDPTHANRLASCSVDGTVRIWDTSPTVSNSYSSSYSSHRSSKVRIINSAATSSSCLASFSTDIDNYVVRFSPCGQFLSVATRSDHVIMFRVDKEKQLVEEAPNDSKSQRKVASSKKNEPKYTTVISLKKLCMHKENDEIYDLCWSNNPSVFALSLGNGNIRIIYFDYKEPAEDSVDEPEETSVALQKSASNDKDVEMTESRVSSMASTPAPLSSEQDPQAHDDTKSAKSSLQVVHTLRGHRTAASCLAFDPKGKYLAAGSNEGIVSLWDVENFICFRTFHKPNHAISSLSISHDGAYIAFGIEGVSGSSHNSSLSAPISSLPHGSNNGINIDNLPIVIAHADSGEYVHGLDYSQFFSPSNISFGVSSSSKEPASSTSSNANGSSTGPANDSALLNAGSHRLGPGTDSAGFQMSATAENLYYGSGLSNNSDFGSSSSGGSTGHFYHSGSQVLHSNSQQQVLTKGTRPLVSWHPLRYCLMYSADTMYNPSNGGFGFGGNAPVGSSAQGAGGPSPLMVLGRF